MTISTARASDWQHSVLDAEHQQIAEMNDRLESMQAQARIEWALEHLPGNHVMTSSFGAQAAVSLHLLTRARTDMPVVLIDTGYLFRETYRFIDKLAEHLDLNLKVYTPPISPAWQEARHGKRWELGAEPLAAYNFDAKVEPMQRALKDLGVGTWFVGLRRDQSSSRSETPIVQSAGERFKVHPIADWSDRDVHRYLREHDLPYHPLWHEGYISIGDHHTTKPIHEVASEEETRFFGTKRECGLHEFDFSQE